MSIRMFMAVFFVIGTVILLSFVFKKEYVWHLENIIVDKYKKDDGSKLLNHDNNLLGNGAYHFDMRMNYVSKLNTTKLDPEKQWKEAFLDLVADFQTKIPEYHSCTMKTWRGNWLDCNTAPFKTEKPCLVYSFGVAYDFSFDDAMAKQGCNVFSFDPSMTETKEHVRPSGVRFYPIGIGNISTDRFNPRIDSYTSRNSSQIWKIRTLAYILEWLGHRRRSLAILKLDIEGYEWNVLADIIKQNLTGIIQQLNIEFHIFPDTPRSNINHFLKIYQDFKDKGFRFHTKKIVALSTDKLRKHFQADCQYVNLKYIFRN